MSLSEPLTGIMAASNPPPSDNKGGSDSAKSRTTKITISVAEDESRRNSDLLYRQTGMSVIQGTKQDPFGKRDIDKLGLFKKHRSIDSASSFSRLHLPEDDTPKDHALSRGLKTPKSVLAPGAGTGTGTKQTRKSNRRPVRFIVDEEGLDIASIRIIQDQDAPPDIPHYAVAYLDVKDDDDADDASTVAGDEEAERLRLRLLFTQPGIAAQFADRVRSQKVALESCVANEYEGSVHGTIRVANMSYNKRVVLRYTINNWQMYEDFQCTYVYYASDGETERFSFYFTLPIGLVAGQQVIFCIKYEAGDSVHWDNNFDINYRIDVLNAAMIQQETDRNFSTNTTGVS